MLQTVATAIAMMTVAEAETGTTIAVAEETHIQVVQLQMYRGGGEIVTCARADDVVARKNSKVDGLATAMTSDLHMLLQLQRKTKLQKRKPRSTKRQLQRQKRQLQKTGVPP